MSISRQALAAALLEYDNDDLPVHAQKDHRRSAIFSLIPPKLPKEYTLPPPNVDSHERQSPIGGRPASRATLGRAGEMGGGMSPGRGLSGGGYHGENDREEVLSPPDIRVEPDAEIQVDIDRWDLPDHLVTEDARPSSRQSQTQLQLSPQAISARPAGSTSGSGGSGGLGGSGGSTRPASTMNINIPGAARQSYTSLARSVPSPITSPLQARAVSVHLEPAEADIVEHLASRSISPATAMATGSASINGLGPANSHANLDLGGSTWEPRRRTISFEAAAGLEPRRRTYSDGPNVAGGGGPESALARVQRLQVQAISMHGAGTGLAPGGGGGGAGRGGTGKASSIMGFPLHDRLAHPEVRIHEPVMVPLPDSPTSEYDRSRPVSAMSALSRGSLGSRGASIDLDRRSRRYGDGLDDDREGDDREEEAEPDLKPNPFALPAPSVHNASRFDPKVVAAAAAGTVAGLSTEDLLSVAPSADLRRPMSIANLARLNRINAGDGSATPIDSGIADTLPLDPQDPLGLLVGRTVFETLPSPEAYGKPLLPSKYARRPPVDKHALLRPKTLIMPTTLVGADAQRDMGKRQHVNVPEGFVLGDKPLPAGARSSILMPALAHSHSHSHSTTSGPLAGLGEGGRFGAALAREQEERDRLEWEAEERERMMAAEARRERMPGKLYGTSLMDQLEARKLQMRGKQRQFGGDSRPAMMARQSMLSIPHSPASPTGPPDKAVRAPLLSFDSNGNLSAAGGASPDQGLGTHDDLPAQNRMSFPHPGMSHSRSAQTHLGTSGMPAGTEDRPRLAKSKSVFGVDTIWEREMAKLKIMQEAEARERAEREESERLKAEKKGNRKSFWAGGKDKVKGKASPATTAIGMEGGSPAARGAAMGRGRSADQGSAQGYGSPGDQEIMVSPEHDPSVIPIEGASPVKRSSDMPPMLEFSPEKKKAAPPPVELDEDEVAGQAAEKEEAADPFAPRHIGTFASGQQVPPTPPPEPEPELPPAPPAITLEDDESSDEEVPLARLKALPTTSTYGKTPTVQLNSDLSGSLGLSVPALPPSVSPRPPSFMGDALAQIGSTEEDEEEDDVPLGVRQSRLIPSPHGGLVHKTSQPLTERPEEEKEEIEDDLPLGFKHAAAVSRRVASGSHMPSANVQQQQQQPPMAGSASMYGFPGQNPYGAVPGHMGMGFPQGSMYGMSGMGVPSMSMGSMGMGMGSMYGGINMGMPMMGGMNGMNGMGGMPMGMQVPSPMAGLGPMPPTEMPGANIDSWRKGVRAPSTVGGESRTSGMGLGGQ